MKYIMKGILLACLCCCVVSFPGSDMTHIQPNLDNSTHTDDSLDTVDRIRTKRDSFEDNMDALDMNQSISKFTIDTFIIPEVRDDVVVGNVGRTEIIAESLYGHLLNWFGHAHRLVIKPGRKEIIHFPRSYFISELNLTNPTRTRAFVYSARLKRQLGAYSVDRPTKPGPVHEAAAMDVLLKLASIRKGKDAYQGPVINHVIGVFWQQRKSHISKKLAELKISLTKNETNSIINSIKLSEASIRNVRYRIETVIEESADYNVFSHYMNIIQDNAGLVEQVAAGKFDKHRDIINYFTLPLVSQAVNIMMMLYGWGIAYADKLRFTESQVEKIKLNRKTLLDGIVKFADDVKIAQEDWVYNNCNPNFFFSDMMEIRTHVAVNLLEYIPIWKYIIDKENNHLNVKNFAYSEFFGESSFNLNNQTLDGYLQQPLTPKLLKINPESNMTLPNELKTIEMINCDQNNNNTICGLNLYFKNGDNYKLGDKNAKSQHGLHLNGARIMKMVVGGDRRIDYITFYLSDNRKVGFGHYRQVPYVIFQLAHHHIASIFAANDVNGLRGQLANIAVSYALS